MESKMSIDIDGNKLWKLACGKYHREDGTSLEMVYDKFWYLNGNQYTEQEFKYKTRNRKLKELLK